MPETGLHPAPEIAGLLAPLGRRKALVGAGAGLFAMGCAGSAKPSGRYLYPQEVSLVQRMAEVMLPVQAFGLPPLADTKLVDRVDVFYAELPPEMHDLLHTGLSLFRYGSWVLGWHFCNFEKLSLPDAAAYCDKWQVGNQVQRGIFAALRQSIFFCYFSDPLTWPAVGYSGPTTRVSGIASRGVTSWSEAETL